MRAHVAHQLDAVALLQADVGDHHVGIQFLDRGARIAGRFRLAANGEVFLVLHDPPQSLTHDRMIVDDQYSPDSALAAGHAALAMRRYESMYC